jgi:hypothetical protein
MRQLSIFSSSANLRGQFSNIVQVTTNLYPPCSISNIFNSCLWRINKDLKQLVSLGAATICWAIWHHRNEIVFETKKCDKFFADATLGYSLAPYLGCTTEAYLLEVDFGYMSTFGASDRRFFFTQAYGWRSCF